MTQEVPFFFFLGYKNRKREGRGRRRRRERRRRRNKKGSHLAEKEEVAKGPEEKQLEMLSTVKEAKKRQLELNIQ